MPAWWPGPRVCHHSGAGVGGLHSALDPPLQSPAGTGDPLGTWGRQSHLQLPMPSGCCGMVPQGEQRCGDVAWGLLLEQMSQRSPGLRVGTTAQWGILGGTSMRLGIPVDAAVGTPTLLGQGQAGTCHPPNGAEGVGSAGCVLAGQAAPATASHRGCHHPSLDLVQFKRARLRVEKAIKVRGLMSAPYQAPAFIALMAQGDS